MQGKIIALHCYQAADKVSVGGVLRQARMDAHLTQEELAFRCELDRGYISEIERGLKSPTLNVFFRICRVLDQEEM